MTTRKFIYFLCGQLGIMLLARFLFQWIIKYASGETIEPDVVGAELFAPAAVGLAMFVFRILDAVSDPVAGSISDGMVRRGKPRRLLVLYWFLVPSVGLGLTFSANESMPPALRWVLLLSGLTLFFLGYTFYAIPYWSLIDDYSQGNAQRQRVLSNLLGAGLLIATGLGFVVSPLMVHYLGYTLSAVLFAVVAASIMILPYLAAPACEPHRHGQQNPAETLTTVDIFRRFFRPFAHPGFLYVLVLFAGAQMALTIMTAAAPFIAVVLLDGSNRDVAFLLGPFLATAMPVFLVTPYLSRRFGWQRILFTASLALGLVFFLTTFLGQALIGSKLLTASLLFACGGPMIALILGVEPEGIASSAREHDPGAISLYFGVFNLVVKALNGVAIFLTGVLAQENIGLSREFAVRAMSLFAGLFVLLGVVLSLLIRPRRVSEHEVVG